MARPLALVWTLIIVAGCLLPGDSLPESVLLSYDKLLHLLAFAGFGLAWSLAAPRARWPIFAAGLLLALLTEGLQHVLPLGRSLDPLDALADTAGLLLGLGLGGFLLRFVRGRDESPRVF